MDHITLTVAAATPEQLARAIVLAENFAAHSGIQAHSGAKDHTLALYNIILTDRLPPAPKAAPATAAGTVPCYSVPTQPDGALHDADRHLLLAWLHRWPDSVERVRITAPRIGDSTTVRRVSLIKALTGF